MATNPNMRSRIGRQIARQGTLRLARRLGVSAPIIGTVVALAAVGVAVRRKGVLGGTIDTALNAIPLFGALKNVIEAVRGDDFIPDRALQNASPVSPTTTPAAASSTRPSIASRAKAIRL